MHPIKLTKLLILIGIDLLNNEYLDIEMVLVVKNRHLLDENRPIAQIERQLMIQLSQDTGTIIQK